MSQTFVKIIELSLLPAITMVFSKLLGVYLTIWVLGIEIVEPIGADDLLALGPAINPSDVRVVTAFSDIFMFAAVATLFSIVLVRAIFFHSSHIKPQLSSLLVQRNLFRLVQSSYEIYHNAAVTLLFLWVSTILVLVDVVVGSSYVWVPVVAFVLASLCTSALLYDVYREVENIRNKPSEYQWI